MALSKLVPTRRECYVSSGPTRWWNTVPGLTETEHGAFDMALPAIIPIPPRVKDLTGEPESDWFLPITGEKRPRKAR